jgi:hypothetical protein
VSIDSTTDCNEYLTLHGFDGAAGTARFVPGE